MFQSSWLEYIGEVEVGRNKLVHTNVLEDTSRKARQAWDLFEHLVVSHRARPSWSPLMEAEGSQLVTEEGTLLFSLITRTNRAHDEWPCALPGSTSRRKFVRSSSRAQPSLLPTFLSFRRYALYGAPVAPACTDHHQMASGDLTRPRATPLRPRNPSHRHPARVTLVSGVSNPAQYLWRDGRAFLVLRSLFKLWCIVGKGDKQGGWSNIEGLNNNVNE